MTQDTLLKLIVVLIREVAQLRGTSASLTAVVEELRITQPSLDHIDAAQIRLDGTQQFYELLERLDPSFAALIDNRNPRQFDTQADPTERF